MEDLTLRASSGAAIPTSPSAFTSTYDTGFALDAGAALSVSTSLLMRARIDYQRFGADLSSFDVDPLGTTLGSAFEADNARGGADLALLGLGLDLEYAFSSGRGVVPYAAAGLSSYRISREGFYAAPLPSDQPAVPPVYVPDHEATTFGLSFGLGLRFPVSYTAAFIIEPRYTIVFSDPERLHFLPLRAGFVFGEF